MRASRVTPRPGPSNHLIDALPRKLQEGLLSRLEPVTITFGEVVCEPDQRFSHVYFPLTSFISLLAPVAGHQPLEMGMAGNEGMIGATLVLGVDSAPLRGLVQGSGSALRMSTRRFKVELRDHPELARVVKRYLYVLIAQLAQTATCTHFHELKPRLARWLLMTHDRAHGDQFHLTHEFLADMLGVQRSAVTIAAGVLQRAGLISYSRGEIRVLSRRGLHAESCECYDAAVGDRDRQFSATTDA